MNVMRYTVVDRPGRVSFVAPCRALLPMVAACARGANTLEELLGYADELGANLTSYVLAGLAVFDEHNVPENLAWIHAALNQMNADATPVFRVMDDVTSRASLQPVAAGAVIFNLNAHRIIQLQNSWTRIDREGLVHQFDGTGRPVRIHRYKLPTHWVLAP